MKSVPVLRGGLPPGSDSKFIRNKTMSNEKITYEIKLQPALLVILGVMAFGILANAFPTASPIQDAKAHIMGFDHKELRGDKDFREAVKYVVDTSCWVAHHETVWCL